MSRAVFRVFTLLLLVGCGGGGGGGGGGVGQGFDEVSGRTSHGLTLTQGAFGTRQIVLRGEYRFRVVGCPRDVCVSHMLSHDSTARESTFQILFLTTTDTPTGSRRVDLEEYEGGQSCFAGLCHSRPINVVKRWTVDLAIVPGADPMSRRHFETTLRCDRLAAVDVDSDGDPDVVTLDRGRQAISVLINANNGELGSEIVHQQPADYVHGFAMGHTDDDEVMDLIAVDGQTSTAPGAVRIHSGSPDAFAETTPLQLKEEGLNDPRVVTPPLFGDIDNDGDRDVLVGVDWHDIANPLGGACRHRK